MRVNIVYVYFDSKQGLCNWLKKKENKNVKSINLYSDVIDLPH